MPFLAKKIKVLRQEKSFLSEKVDQRVSKQKLVCHLRPEVAGEK